jgi:hypothetical protein
MTLTLIQRMFHSEIKVLEMAEQLSQGLTIENQSDNKSSRHSKLETFQTGIRKEIRQTVLVP